MPLPRLAALVLITCLSAPALAQSVDEVNARLDTIFGEHETFGDVFAVLQSAVAAGDAATVASLVKYPFEVVAGGEEMVLRSEDAFIEHYPQIITDGVAEAVMGQVYAELFVNQDGVMFGDGELWLTNVCLEDSCAATVWLISAVNTDMSGL